MVKPSPKALSSTPISTPPCSLLCYKFTLAQHMPGDNPLCSWALGNTLYMQGWLLLCPQCLLLHAPVPDGEVLEPVTCPGRLGGLNSEENGRKQGMRGVLPQAVLSCGFWKNCSKWSQCLFGISGYRHRTNLHMMLCVISNPLSTQRAQRRLLQRSHALTRWPRWLAACPLTQTEHISEKLFLNQIQRRNVGGAL